MVMQIKDIASVNLKREDGKTKLELFHSHPEIMQLREKYYRQPEVMEKEMHKILSPLLLRKQDWAIYLAWILTVNSIDELTKAGVHDTATKTQLRAVASELFNELNIPPKIRICVFNDKDLEILNNN